MVNESDWKGVVLHDRVNMYACHSFSGPPFSYKLHSSKPIEFYEEFVPKFVTVYCKQINYNRCQKVDLFTREMQVGFTSAGLQFNGIRSTSFYVRCEICKKRVVSTNGEKEDNRKEAPILCCSDAHRCGRVWHVKCIPFSDEVSMNTLRNSLFDDDGLCTFCVNAIGVSELIVQTQRKKQTTKRVSKKQRTEKFEGFKLEHGPTKKVCLERQVAVQGYCGQTWFGKTKSHPDDPIVYVVWDKPAKRGPKEEAVDQACVEWI